tara:strand:+ start:2259 stop:2606 length:348 start_codon:yes stop_codon:yes gene_type:complete
MKILTEGVLEIYNPLTCREKLREVRNSPYGGGLGYRQYIDVTIYDLCLLWPEEMGHFLGSINSAMGYPSIIRCKIYPPVEDYRTFHDEKFLERLFSGKGFSKVRIKGDWIIGEKA